jgi:hypothetical protein
MCGKLLGGVEEHAVGTVNRKILVKVKAARGSGAVEARIMWVEKAGSNESPSLVRG